MKDFLQLVQMQAECLDAHCLTPSPHPVFFLKLALGQLQLKQKK